MAATSAAFCLRRAIQALRFEQAASDLARRYAGGGDADRARAAKHLLEAPARFHSGRQAAGAEARKNPAHAGCNTVVCRTRARAWNEPCRRRARDLRRDGWIVALADMPSSVAKRFGTVARAISREAIAAPVSRRTRASGGFRRQFLHELSSLHGDTVRANSSSSTPNG